MQETKKGRTSLPPKTKQKRRVGTVVVPRTTHEEAPHDKDEEEENLNVYTAMLKQKRIFGVNHGSRRKHSTGDHTG